MPYIMALRRRKNRRNTIGSSDARVQAVTAERMNFRDAAHPWVQRLQPNHLRANHLQLRVGGYDSQQELPVFRPSLPMPGTNNGVDMPREGVEGEK